MRLVPFGMLAAAAAWLAIRWEDLPSRWIVHWGPGGVPNGWATKTFGGVFGPLLLGAVLAVFLELLAVFLERFSRARYPKLAQAYGNFVRWVSVAVVGSISTLAVLLPSPTPPSPRMVAPLILGAVVLALVAGAWGLVRATRRADGDGRVSSQGLRSPLLPQPRRAHGSWSPSSWASGGPSTSRTAPHGSCWRCCSCPPSSRSSSSSSSRDECPRSERAQPRARGVRSFSSRST